MLEEKNVLIPALRVNNRSVNQDFLENELGLKTVLEEGPFAEFSGHTGDKIAKLVLIESPSMRTREVKGLKKLARLTLKVENPSEIENLLARGAAFNKLYRGQNGFAFETTMPEGYLILLHGEKTVADLEEVQTPLNFEEIDDFAGLTEFSVEQILINTPNPQASQDFYQTVLPGQAILAFQKARGQDLLTSADATWDLDSLRVPVGADFNLASLEKHLSDDYYIDKKKTFLQTTDPSNIEIWFEK